MKTRTSELLRPSGDLVDTLLNFSDNLPSFVRAGQGTKEGVAPRRLDSWWTGTRHRGAKVKTQED